jgi:hypothetical protein
VVVFCERMGGWQVVGGTGRWIVEGGAGRFIGWVVARGGELHSSGGWLVSQ